MYTPARTFIPFHKIKDYSKVVVVDSYHPTGIILSHWRGAAPKDRVLAADTSAGIVLNALQSNYAPLQSALHVTNNHFDVDGFVGIWSLCFPQLALQYAEVLEKMALLGDFRELRLESEADHLALKLVCWINTVEKEKFYAPFASFVPGKSEVKLCVQKYDFFIPAFTKVLLNPNAYKKHWQEEYEEVVKGIEIIESPASKVELVQDIRLLIVETPEPLHYYALFAKSEAADMVLSIYSQNRYELEYKYTTWVDTAFRLAYPRINLQPLAKKLNLLEKNNYQWQAEKITDTGPILRLESIKLTKEQRFDNPTKRSIFSSSISAKNLRQQVEAFYRIAYQQTERKSLWSWNEMKEVNSTLKL